MRTFQKGGVHPEENKLSNQAVIENFPLPKQAVLYVSQHLGAPATVVVEKGQKVKVGTLLAKAEAFICANLHSPFSGTITKIDVADDLFGYPKPAIYIDVEGDEYEDFIDTSDTIVREITLSGQEIIDRVKECGIVGLGGACFPTHAKLMLPPGKTADYLIVNGVECEPYLTSDFRVMMEHGEECLIGITALMKAINVKVARVGIEANKPEAIAHMTELAKNYPGIEICPLKVKYPQGAEKQLIKALTGREVPSGKLPIEVGCVVNNIGTTFAVYEAVQKHRPLIDNITTITGKSVKEHKNYRLRNGVPFQMILEQIGGMPADTGKVISGGPMMGKAISNLNAYVSKGMSSMLFMKEEESSRHKSGNCIRCAKCVEACPMGLEPYLLEKLSEQHQAEGMEQNRIYDCIECGCCQFTCPAFRPLLDRIRVGKSKVMGIIRARAAAAAKK